MVIFCHGAKAFETSFPFPFEFGHSSDIYLKKYEPTKEENRKAQRAREILIENKIKTDPVSIIKYIRKNDLQKLSLIIDSGFSPNTLLNGNPPVYYSSRYNKPRVTYLLLRSGAKPNIDFYSPLKFAVEHKDYDIAKTLIEYGADVNYADRQRAETILYSALKTKQYELAKILIKNGAKMDIKSLNLIEKNNLQTMFDI